MEEKQKLNITKSLYKQLLHLIENIIESLHGNVNRRNITNILKRNFGLHEHNKIVNVQNNHLLQLMIKRLENTNFKNKLKKTSSMYKRRLSNRINNEQNKLKKLHLEKELFNIQYNPAVLMKISHYRHLLEQIRLLENPTYTGPNPYFNASNQVIREQIEWNKGETQRYINQIEAKKAEREKKFATRQPLFNITNPLIYQ